MLKIYMCDAQVNVICKNTHAVETIIRDVTKRVRSEVLSYRKNILPDDPYYLPIETQGVACALVIEALQSRIPGLKLSESQKRNTDHARCYLKRIARGEVFLDSCNAKKGRGFAINAGRNRRMKINSRYLASL